MLCLFLILDVIGVFTASDQPLEVFNPVAGLLDGICPIFPNSQETLLAVEPVKAFEDYPPGFIHLDVLSGGWSIPYL